MKTALELANGWINNSPSVIREWQDEDTDTLAEAVVKLSGENEKLKAGWNEASAKNIPMHTEIAAQSQEIKRLTERCKITLTEMSGWIDKAHEQAQALKEAEKFVRYSKNSYAGMNAGEHIKKAEDWLAKYGEKR